MQGLCKWITVNVAKSIFHASKKWQSYQYVLYIVHT